MSSFAIPGVDFQPITITKWIEHGDKLDLWGRRVEIRHCPGHCPGNIIFWIRKENICFVGDVIFSGSIGRADLPGGDFVISRNQFKITFIHCRQKLKIARTWSGYPS